MSDDRPTAVAFPGPPETWLATLRDLCRHVRGESPSAAGLREWVGDRLERDDAADADRYLDFLDALDVLDRAGAEPSLGSYGRDFLDSHDERVLFETLTANVAGLQALVEVLAIRPVTDVEATELLSTELETDIEDPAAYRGWLVALGYADYEDGVIDLTTKGRRLVDSDAELSDGAASRLPSTKATAAAEAATEEGIPTDEATTTTEPDLAADPGASADAPKAAAPAPKPAESAPSPPSDDEAAALAARHDFRCMVCGDQRRQAPDEGYAEVHYLMPPAEPHDGPTDADNAVVVCPNHRADLDHGLIRIDAQSLTVEHAYEADVSGRTLRTVEGHDLGAQYLAYHNDVIADF